jgi:hypothetical protein
MIGTDPVPKHRRKGNADRPEALLLQAMQRQDCHTGRSCVQRIGIFFVLAQIEPYHFVILIHA